MSQIELRADCARCAALCCVAFHFERSNQFGCDKAAGRPCGHLGRDGRCGIYRDRADRGFRGCVGYDCHGAGQRVTQALFGGRSWMDDPALLAPMAEAFLRAERAHRLLAILRKAGNLDLAAEDRWRHARLEEAFEAAAVEGGPGAALEAQARAFFRTLRRYVAPRGAGNAPGRAGPTAVP
ncbi:MAG: hypothetical protein JNL41_19720 [Phenylobacterium sp.]|uniref:hypothetical protein n=1 Tax=Phenylobacterium sp. TaxID=1871053 RepID=UPI001A53910D|nr:hypothetical protein [Phenylobacterium sp.]MBL8556511.1 hypothetical protein [Phenylobacterium sp.]